MIIVYVRISDLSLLEDYAVSHASDELDVHIVSDLAWADQANQFEIRSSPSNLKRVQELIPKAVVTRIAHHEEVELSRRYGC